IEEDNQNGGQFINKDNAVASKTVSLKSLGRSRLNQLLAQESMRKDISNAEWVELVNTALSARECYKKGSAYDVKPNEENGELEVQIIDERSGKIYPGRRWQGNLHAAVEIKEGLEPKPEGLTPNMLTIHEYLSLDCMKGLMGTSGTIDAEFSNRVFNLKMGEPAASQNRASRIETAYMYAGSAEGEAKRQSELLSSIKGYGEVQPVLVKVRDANEGKALAEKLRQETSLNVIEYTMDDSSIKNEKGEPVTLKDIEDEGGKVGVVTIVTNNGSRGVDIKIDALRNNINALAEAKKIVIGRGLHVVTTYIDEETSTFLQTKARGARNGLPGEYTAFLSESDPLFAKLKDSMGGMPAKTVRSMLNGQLRIGVVMDAGGAEKGAGLYLEGVPSVARLQNLLEDMRMENEKQEISSAERQKDINDYYLAKKRVIQGMIDAAYDGRMTNDLKDFLSALSYKINEDDLAVPAIREAVLDALMNFRKGVTTSLSRAQQKIQSASARYGWRQGIAKVQDAVEIKSAVNTAYEISRQNTQVFLAEKISEALSTDEKKVDVTVKRPGNIGTYIGNVIGVSGIVLLSLRVASDMGLVQSVASFMATPFLGLQIILPLMAIGLLAGWLVSGKRTGTVSLYAASSIVASMAISSSLLFRYFVVTSGGDFTAGGVAANMASLSEHVWSVSPALAIAMAGAVIGLAFAMYFTKVTNLSKIDDSQRKLLEIIRGVEPRSAWDVIKTIGRVAVQEPLRLIASMTPTMALFTMIAAVAVPEHIKILVELAILFATAGFTASTILYLMNMKELDRARPATVSQPQRAYRQAVFSVLPVIAALLLLKAVPLFMDFTGVNVAIGAASLIGVVAATLFSRWMVSFSKQEAYRSIETSDVAGRMRLFGTAGGLGVLSAAIVLGQLMNSSAAVFTVFSIAGMVPFALTGFLYFVVMPFAVYIYGAAHRSINEASAIKSGIFTFASGAIINIRGTAVSMGAVWSAGAAASGYIFNLMGPYAWFYVAGFVAESALLATLYYFYTQRKLQEASEGRA
ncbi:MAG: hypothetical protein WCY36_08300, partial [Candidatus Omnitrophota bacterium]